MKDDKSFSAMDLVSPCPPKVQCVWAGIVGWSGRWELNDSGAILTKTSGGTDPTKKSNTNAPLHLILDKASMLPAEMSDSGAPCVYARAGEDASKR